MPLLLEQEYVCDLGTVSGLMTNKDLWPLGLTDHGSSRTSELPPKWVHLHLTVEVFRHQPMLDIPG